MSDDIGDLISFDEQPDGSVAVNPLPVQHSVMCCDVIMLRGVGDHIQPATMLGIEDAGVALIANDEPTPIALALEAPKIQDFKEMVDAAMTEDKRPYWRRYSRW